MFPSTGTGAGVLAVRHRQVHVDDDGSLAVGDGSGREVLAPPGSLVRAVLVPDPSYPELGLLDHDGPRVRLPLWRYTDAVNVLGSDELLLHATGASALTRALGLGIAPASAADRQALRRVAALDPHRPARHRGDVVLLVIALVLLVFPAVAALAVAPWALVPVVLLAAGLAAGPTLRLVRRRATLLEAVTGLPDLPGASSVAPTHPSAVRQRTLARTLVSPRRVVVHHHGRETWLPGPAAGGVTRLLRTPDLLLWQDRRGITLAASAGGWAEDPTELERACRHAGIEVAVDETPFPVHAVGSPEAWPAHEGFGRPPVRGAAPDSDLWVPSLLAFVVPALVVEGLLCALAHPVAALSAVPGAALAVVWVGSGRRVRAWQRGEAARGDLS